MVHPPVRVVEISSPFARFAGRILVGLGFEVILVEPPTGDPSRTESQGDSYLHWHAGKKSVVLDIDDSNDRIAFEALLRSADVLLDGSATGALRDNRGSLVHVRVTPFGTTGPRSDWKATNLTVAALGGMMAQVGDPEHPPLLLPELQAEQLAGINAAIGVLLGLRSRSKGHNPLLEISAQECVAAALEAGTLAYIHEDRVPPRPGRVHPLVPHGLFQAADGYVGGGLGGSPRMWDGMLAWLIDNDAQDDLDQPEWSDAVYRKTHQEHIFDVLSVFIAKWPKEEFAVSAQSRKLPWAAVDRPEELLRNPQLNDRDFFTDVTGDHGTYRDLGFGFAFPEGRRIGTLEAARLGQHQELLKATSPVAVNETHEFSGGSTPSLEGVRVLDLTWVLAGPYGTRILADHGADVIKVESIGRPDPTRFAPFMHLSRGPHDNPNTSGYFNDVNRNKRSITLDTRSAEGLSVLRDLIRNSDVVVENFSSSVMDKMGLGYEQLRELNPDIIYVSMSGMGHTGPRKDWVSYADIVSASTGLTALTGWNADDVVGVIYGHGDIVAGLQAGVAMLAALDYRDRTGRGQHVDLSQLEAMAAHMGTSVLRAARSQSPDPIGNSHHELAPHGVYPCLGSDRWCSIAIRDTTEWNALCRIIEAEKWIGNPDFASAESRQADHERIDDAIADWTRTLSPETVMERLQSAGIAAGTVQDGRDLVESDPHLRARSFYSAQEHPLAGTFLHEGIPVRRNSEPGSIRRAAPVLGADTDDVLESVLGYSDELIAGLRDQSILS